MIFWIFWAAFASSAVLLLLFTLIGFREPTVLGWIVLSPLIICSVPLIIPVLIASLIFEKMFK